jgi:hypothetical protein
MRYEKYQFRTDEDLKIFEFLSVGKKGSIKKRVYFQLFENTNVHNLAFGDVNLETDDLDDTVITDNGDTEKVLATVATTVFAFLDKYTNAIVHAMGATPSRTRLYQIGISKNIEELQEKYQIFGLFEDSVWTEFKKNVPYSAFYIKNKSR